MMRRVVMIAWVLALVGAAAGVLAQPPAVPAMVDTPSVTVLQRTTP
jgi:hypothetical protein